jgi:hypothetical protein
MDFPMIKGKIHFLRTLAEYGMLTIKQIAALEQIGVRAANKRIKKLSDENLIEVSPRVLSQSKGRPEIVAALSLKGAQCLRDEGEIKSDIPLEILTGKSINHIDHQLLINWFRIHLIQTERLIKNLDTGFFSATTPFLQRRKDGSPIIADAITIDGKQFGFIPDGAFSVHCKEQGKRLLFFLEVDMSTESLTSRKARNNIASKIKNYRQYFSANGYKRYEKAWECRLNGFRLLILANTAQRLESLSRLVREMQPSDFVWLTDQDRMFGMGLGAKIWFRGGQTNTAPQSILGPTLATKTPLTQ